MPGAGAIERRALSDRDALRLAPSSHGNRCGHGDTDLGYREAWTPHACTLAGGMDVVGESTRGGIVSVA